MCFSLFTTKFIHYLVPAAYESEMTFGYHLCCCLSVSISLAVSCHVWAMWSRPAVNSSLPLPVCLSSAACSGAFPGGAAPSAQLLSGCHIPRWHVVTGSSGHACCPTQTDPLHRRGQGQNWDRPAETGPSKLSQKPQEAPEGPDVRGVRTDWAHSQEGMRLPRSRVMLYDDHSLLGAACFGKVF